MSIFKRLFGERNAPEASDNAPYYWGTEALNRYEAIAYITDNWDLLIDVLDEFGCDAEEFIRNPEAADVSIRCYLLGEAISEVLDEYEEELSELAEQDDEEETEVA